MRLMHWTFLLAVLAVGFVLGTMSQTGAVAQAPAQPGPRDQARFEISAFAGVTPGGVFHGCYMVDTATGELWVTIPDQPTKRLGEPPRK